jgi:hypothetical protein
MKEKKGFPDLNIRIQESMAERAENRPSLAQLEQIKS